MGFRNWTSLVKWGIVGIIFALFISLSYGFGGTVGEGNGKLIYLFFMVPFGIPLFMLGVPIPIAIFINIFLIFLIIGLLVGLFKRLLKNKRPWLKGMLLADIIFLVPDLAVGGLVLYSHPQGPLPLGVFLVSSAILLVIISGIGAVLGGKFFKKSNQEVIT